MNLEFRQRSSTNDKEMGSNGDAALNVMADFASRPNFCISQAAKVDQLQKRSGDWVDDFLKKMKKDAFDFDVYLSAILE